MAVLTPLTGRPRSPPGSSPDPTLFLNPLFFEVVDAVRTALAVGQSRSVRTIAPNLSLSCRKASSNACFQDSAPTKGICRTLVHRISCTPHQAKRLIRCIIWVVWNQLKQLWPLAVTARKDQRRALPDRSLKDCARASLPCHSVADESLRKRRCFDQR